MASFRFPNLRQAMQQAAQLVQQKWQQIAQRWLTSPGEQQAYTRGLQSPESVTYQESATTMQATVTNTDPAAVHIESGSPTIHLPSHIDWSSSPHARRSKDGRYYIIVPFRHYSAQRGSRAQAGSAAARRQMMPRAVYEQAKRLQPGESLHLPGAAPYVPRNPQNIRPGYTHAPMHERMQRQGTGRRTVYLTFRTMRQDSPGWWIPARPPKPMAAQASRESAAEVERIITTAARDDAATLIHQSLKGP